MPVDLVRADYPKLDVVAQTFDREAERVRRVHESIEYRLTRLKRGGWEGDNANEFYQSVALEITALSKLHHALAQAAHTTRTISKTLQEAEAEASACLKGEDANSDVTAGPTVVTIAETQSTTNKNGSTRYREPPETSSRQRLSLSDWMLLMGAADEQQARTMLLGQLATLLGGENPAWAELSLEEALALLQQAQLERLQAWLREIGVDPYTGEYSDETARANLIEFLEQLAPTYQSPNRDQWSTMSLLDLALEYDLALIMVGMANQNTFMPPFGQSADDVRLQRNWMYDIETGEMAWWSGVGTFAASVLVEPVDWALTVRDLANGDGTALIGFLPFIPGASRRLFGLGEDVADLNHIDDLPPTGARQHAPDGFGGGGGRSSADNLDNADNAGETIETLWNTPNATQPGSNEALHEQLEALNPNQANWGPDGRPELRNHPSWQADPNIQIQNANAAVLEGRYNYNVINEPTAAQLEAVGYFDEGVSTRRSASNPGHMPDYILDGHVFDSLAPSSQGIDQLWSALIDKVPGQTTRIVLDLENTALSTTVVLDAIASPEFRAVQLDELQEVIIMENGEILAIWVRS